MMSIDDLTAGYGRIGVLRGVSLEIEAGTCVGILGHNGMGKTTLLKTIMGLLPATGGSITFDRQPITLVPAHARARLGLGYVPQGRQVFPNLTVHDNLRFATAAKANQNPGILESVLAEFPELKRLLDRRGSALSGGEQQLLALARALCGAPKLLLLDEPTEGIQPSIVQALVERIDLLRRRRGLTVLLVEQNLEFIRGLASRVLLIHRGRITEEISASALEDGMLVQQFVGRAT
jgi:branched-chain amino acid transport system ATP-binding protein